jgi:ribulose-5-phosphate 4-epimerase/fuculose-1-phosphate aldolase
MWSYIAQLLASDFMPHGHCYRWQPEILWTHVLSDAGIALSYFSIPVALAVFVRRCQDIAFNWIFMLFATFIEDVENHVLRAWSEFNGFAS